MEEEYTTLKTQNESQQEAENENENEEYHVVYCGPNIPAKGILTNQIFIGGLPLYVRDAVEEIPEIEKLLVPVRGYSEMRAKIKRKGTAENIMYERIRGKVKL